MKHEKEVTKADERAYDAQNERAEGKSGQAVCVTGRGGGAAAR